MTHFPHSDARPGNAHDPFAGPALERVVPLTAAQRELWLATQLGRDASLAFNEAYRVDFHGSLDADALVAAMSALVERHESLRATVTPDGSALAIHVASRLQVLREDLSSLETSVRERVLTARADADVSEPFDLASGPLLRARLLKFAPDSHALLLTIHHIVCDGWSFGVLVEELAALYRVQRGAREALPPAEPFSAFALREATRQGSPEAAADERYWLDVFAKHVPTLDLPTDSPRPPVRRRDSARVDRRIPREVAAALPAAAASLGASPFSLLTSAFALCLGRIASTDDLVIGVPSAGQAAAEMPRVVGHCVNLLPLRLPLDETKRVRDAVQLVQARVLDAAEHQEYTYGTLLTRLLLPRDASRPPLVSVMFNLDQRLPTESLRFDGLRVAMRTMPRRYETFELFVSVVPDADGYGVECQYATALFDEATVDAWLASFIEQLRAMLAQPDAELSALPLVPAEQAAAIDGWNATGRGFSGVLHQLVRQQAERSPSAQALRDAAGALDYATLWREVSALAAELRAAGVAPGDRVGVSVRRSRHIVLAPLAVLAAGAAYVPLDPAHPAARLQSQAEDAGLRLVVADDAGAERFDASTALIRVDRARDGNAAPGDEALPEVSADATAYVIYTSGSTGEPKGVAVPHRALVNVLRSVAAEPGLSAQDRLVAVTTLSFDISALELFLPLVVGAEVIIADSEATADPQRLLALLRASRATVLQATPSTYRLLLDAGLARTPGLRMWVGGEPLPRDLAEAMRACGDVVWNMYGPTETTVWSTCWRVDDVSGGVRVGRPLAGTRVEIRDAFGRRCGVGVPGEIVIGGAGVADGYWRRPELTATRFSSEADGTRWYRSGDRGRWCADGTLEHLGRLDLQLKLRGHRIEPGEIESALRESGLVSDAVVVTHAASASDVRLVAYVVPAGRGMPELRELVAALRSRVPEYMLPQHFVPILRVPRQASGKLDRRGLPDPLAVQQAALVGTGERPVGEREQVVAEEMAAVLRLPDLRRDDDFFSLGGHSLLAAQLVSRLSRRLGQTIPLSAVLTQPTVRGLASWSLSTRSASASALPPIARRTTPTGVAPLSFAQHRLLFIEQLNPDAALYNTPSGHRLQGPLDLSAFTQAFADVVERQPSLRTTFERDASGELHQRLLPRGAVTLGPTIDLSALLPDERERALLKALSERSQEPFELFGGALVRSALFRLAADEHVLFLMLHHAIWDGWSFDIFYRDFDACYSARLAGRAPELPPLPVSYGDFAAWQRETLTPERLRPQLDYWTERLRGALEPLELPTDRPRPAVQTGAADTLWFDIAPATSDRLRATAQRLGATPFEFLMAVFSLFVSRATGRRAMVIGAPVRGRAMPELEDVMGLFVTFLPVRVDIEPSATFTAHLRRVRDQVREGLAHPDVPFEHLVRELDLPRDGRTAPLFQVVLSYQDGRDRPLRWGNLRHTPNFVRRERIAEDLTVSFVEREDGLRGAITYNTDIFAQASIARLRGRLAGLLDAALAAPSATLFQLSEPAEDDLALEASWNSSPPATRGLVYPLFEAQLRRTPDALALEDEHGRWTYAELAAAVERLARTLRARGVKPRDRVGILLARGRAVVQAELALLSIGAAYVPLDPTHPALRLRATLDDAEARLVIAQQSLPESTIGARDLLLVDDPEVLQAAAGALPQPDLLPDDAAYVIYTSGSTGTPKGVAVSHASLVNFLAAMAQVPGLSSQDRVLSVTTPAFDIAALELLLPLTVGASVRIANAEQVADGASLRRLLEESRATLMQATPSTYKLLVAAGWSGDRNLTALVGGEALPPDLASTLLPQLRALWNMYGPTETTVWSTCWRVVSPRSGIRIGKPIAGTQVQVWDADGRRCPVGVAGELVIGGAGVAIGYWNRPELNAERFRVDANGQRWYRSGDRGRWCDDGTLEHLGRLDRQIKLRGFRIEPSEIEGVLRAHPVVQDAVVLLHAGAAGDPRLVAYVVPNAGASPTGTALRTHAREHLPPYMVPGVFVQIERVPRLTSGKLDVAALPNPFATAQSSRREYAAPRTPTERAIAAVWQELLQVERIDANDGFLDLGGHSLLSMQAAVRLERELGQKVRLRSFFTQTLAQMAASLDAEAARAPSSSPSSTRRRS